jgi:hypothetical protein
MFRHVSCPLCKSLLGEEQPKCCPLCKMFSWRGSSHRNLSRKALRSSFLRDSSAITLSPFLSGIESRWGSSRRRSMVDSFSSSVSITLHVAVLFFCSALYLLFGLKTIFRVCSAHFFLDLFSRAAPAPPPKKNKKTRKVRQSMGE